MTFRGKKKVIKLIFNRAAKKKINPKTRQSHEIKEVELNQSRGQSKDEIPLEKMQSELIKKFQIIIIKSSALKSRHGVIESIFSSHLHQALPEFSLDPHHAGKSRWIRSTHQKNVE